MSNNGFVMIPRSLLTSAVWLKATQEQRLAIVDLYFRVAYSECVSKKYPDVKISPGQIAASQNDLETFWNMNRSKVRRTILYLKKHDFVATNLATTRNGTVTLLTIRHLHNTSDHPCDQACDQHKEKNINNKALSLDNAPDTHARAKRFVRPSPDEVQQYLDSKGITAFTGEKFCSYYDSCGWVVGRNKPMKSWHGAVSTWVQIEKKYQNNHATETIKHTDRRAQRDAEHERIRQGIVHRLMYQRTESEPKLPF